ncbi:MAG: MarR family winged helix-turn-helix transcriptional regulator [Flammeovirgaceae bacterium]
MEEDFLKELGYLSLATRLKRVSDRMIHSGRAMYKSLGVDLEPNWYMVFRLLMKYDSLSVTEVAQKLQFSHPSIISIVNKMIKSGYLESTQCPEDGRRQLLKLTEKAYQSLPQFEQLWEAGIKGVEQMMEGMDFLPLLTELEERLAKSDFMERTLNEYKP